MFPRTEMLDLVVVDGRARGIVARDLVTGKIESHVGDAVVLATGGYGNVFYLSTNAKGCNVTAIWRAYKQGRLLRQPLLHADPPDLHPGHRRLPVEADADVRVAAQRRPHLGAEEGKGDKRDAGRDPRGRARLLPRAQVPGFGNLVPRDIASRAAKQVCDEGRGVGPGGRGVYLDFADAIERLGEKAIARALRQPLRDVRAHHRRGPVQGADAHLPRHPLHDGRPVGGLQPDEHDPRPVRARRGELLRPRRQPPRRQRAHAGPRRRLLRHPLHDRQLPRARRRPTGRRRRTRSSRTRRRASRRPTEKLLAIKGKRTVDSFHRELGKIMWENCGMARNEGGPRGGARARSPSSARSSGRTSRIPGTGDELNQALEKAGRVADFLEFGELMCLDALAARRIVRRPLPRGVPDARGRGAARRRQVLLRRRLGVQGRRTSAETLAQGAARVRATSTSRRRSYK